MELPCSNGQGRHCSLTDFRIMVTPYLPVDFAAECHLPSDEADDAAGAMDLSISGGGEEEQQQQAGMEKKKEEGEEKKQAAGSEKQAKKEKKQ